jgi:choline dehydrogenase
VSPSVAFGFANASDLSLPPDIQLNFTPGSYAKSVSGLLDNFPGMTLGFYQLRPESTGDVWARSANPFEDPIIQPNYLMHEEDKRVAIAGIKLVRRLLAGPDLQPYYEREESPGLAVTEDADLLDFARTSGSTAYHLMGTCRMAPKTDPYAVVDDELKVHGLEGLRVVDASIMPTMPSANTCASTFMIAEKASDMILGRPPLAAQVFDAVVDKVNPPEGKRLSA